MLVTQNLARFTITPDVVYKIVCYFKSSDRVTKLIIAHEIYANMMSE